MLYICESVVKCVGGAGSLTPFLLRIVSKMSPASGREVLGKPALPWTLRAYGVPARPKSGFSRLFPPPSARRIE